MTMQIPKGLAEALKIEDDFERNQAALIAWHSLARDEQEQLRNNIANALKEIIPVWQEFVIAITVTVGALSKWADDNADTLEAFGLLPDYSCKEDGPQ